MDEQRKRIAMHAAIHAFEIVAYESDAGRSAGTLDRPGLRRALSKLKSGVAGTLIVLKLDRLTRSVRDLGRLLEEFFGPSAPYQLVCVLDQIDTGTANGRLTANVLMSVAQWEREITSERTAIVKSSMRDRGEYLGGEVPFGYTVVERDGRKLLVPSEEERKAISIILDLRRLGESFAGIARHLNGAGIPARNGKPWTRQRVHRVVRSQTAERP